jgi:hypothetical protein
MLNELEQMVSNECVAQCLKIEADSRKLMGNNKKELSEHQIQTLVLNISAGAERVRKYLSAMQNNYNQLEQ